MVYNVHEQVMPESCHYLTALPDPLPLLEVILYWKVSFGARGLSVIRNSEVVRYSGAENVLRLRE